MATPVNSRPANKRYLGNTNKIEVHDLRNETTQCQIDEIIRAGHAVVFTPDAVEQAKSEGYDRAHYCLGGSTR